VTPGVVAAAAFLTRFPVGRATVDPRAVAAAAPYYPVVGAVLGAGAGGAGVALGFLLPSTLAAALVVALLAVATGGMHLDALADAADAAGGRTRAERLRIMRDHSVGAFGATAVALFVVVEVAAFAALLENEVRIALDIVAAFAASRAAAVGLAAVMPYARGEEGVPAFVTRRHAAAASVVAAALCVPAGVSGLAALAATATVAAASALACRRWLAGVTGDTLGATVALAEASALVAAVALR
jgi:adenosylcobinamide-GDP ribazoletransferase